MKTIQISKVAYDLLMSKRIGREAISTTIIRELKTSKKCSVKEELERLRKAPHYTADEVEKMLGI